MRLLPFPSASGLRPTAAFFTIAVAFVCVALRVSFVSLARSAQQPDRMSDESGVLPSYTIEGARGEQVARFVPRFDLEMSPRSMWRAHTPRYMAERIAQALDGMIAADELLARMLPDAVGGIIQVDAWDLSARCALRLKEWIASGAGTLRGPLHGIWIERKNATDGGAPRFGLSWSPGILLSRAVRQSHGYQSAWAWARHIGTGLEGALRRPSEPEAKDARELDSRLRAIWNALQPSGFCRPLRNIPSHLVLDLRELLIREAVAPWQMKIAYDRDRIYPCGRHELYGSWGFTRPDQTEAAPRAGLELSCDRLLAEQAWSFLAREPDVYRWIQDRSVRGQRADGFLSYSPPSPAPVVGVTIDLGLQGFVHTELERVMQVHRPALAMALVLEVESGDVLAVDSIEEYEVQPFAPVFHTFTPGSSMKMVTMAIALEEGLVRPETEFDVGQADFVLRLPEGSRSIHEAEGFLEGRQSAAWCLAGSSNAGLAQIGTRVDDDVFRDYLVRLGYGGAPLAGLGSERAGYLAALPWKRVWTHASVSFGHELTTTLWQHAAALATVMRRGRWRPLRLLREVRQGGERHPIPLASAQRVFSKRTSREVREMMQLGAREGTGRAHWREDLDLATKTGTAEKVASEICVHLELGARQRCREGGIRLTAARYEALRGRAREHASCYTSSMCMLGRLPGDERQLMVLVVVDEPRGKQRFGSKVAGPAAARMLVEALGLTRGGRVPPAEPLPGFAPSSVVERNELDDPWRAPW